MPPNCQHQVLQLDPSPFAELAGYAQPTMQERAAAATLSGRASKPVVAKSSRTYPAPLVVPHDELNYDPDCPPQSVSSWLRMKSRNKMSVKNGRDTLYIGRVPRIEKEVEFMRDWTRPKLEGVDAEQGSPDGQLFVDYLAAFYHGLDVKLLDKPLAWTVWDKTSQPRRRADLPKYVGLAHGSECTRIRVRNGPDGTFVAQLNLNDIIDAAIAMLPDDAYALLLLVDHDIHESEEDDFCCGRAYGGSRVAVVQSARYNPSLDIREGIDRAHMWPFSHCKDFVDELCAVEEVEAQPPTKAQIASLKTGSLRAAVNVASSAQQEAAALWFSRLARTVSHELGHCFGMAHCVYYACNMQGTAGMKEDVRQPPYLCPVCEAKVSHAVVGELRVGNEEEKMLWIKERCGALSDFCTRLNKDEMSTAMWVGLNGWLGERVKAN
jgi:archaemetzincin